MASLSPDPREHYALNILTEAAMHTRHTATSGSRYPRHEGHYSNAPITNQQNSYHLEAARQSVVDEYNASMISPRNLDHLAFNTVPQDLSQHAFLKEAHGAIDPQLVHANNLRILNAETYDDGRGTARDERSKNTKHELPFGISNHPQVRLNPPLHAIVDEQDSGPRRKKAKIENESQDGEEGIKGKARGRPRVSPKDETAADRRRTQIRVAQRAYRHRKESTISSLEKKVQDLMGTNEEMGSIFINLYDFAVSNGLLQREPEFSQQLRATAEKFLALAKTSADEGQDENQEDISKADEPDEHRSNVQKGSHKRYQEMLVPVSEPLVSEPTLTYGGYVATKDETPGMDITYSHDGQHRDNRDKANKTSSSDLQIITRPTEDNASFPFNFMDLQQYHVEVPATEEFSQLFLPQSQPLPPKSFAQSELSLARRIHRLAIERGFMLITSDDPAAEAITQRVFRFSLMYLSKEDIIARLHRHLRTSGKDTLQNWRAPFVNIGGAGTHYPLSEGDADWELASKFGTGYSMGPFTTTVTEAQGFLDDDMKTSIPGLERYFFDSNNVEEYLRARGINIAPAADFVAIELDTLGMPDPSSPNSTSSNSALSKTFPGTPESTVEVVTIDAGKAADALAIDLVDNSFQGANPMSQYLPFPLGFTSWDDEIVKIRSDSTNPLSKLEQNENGLVETNSNVHRNNKRTVTTIDVNLLIDRIINRGVCLDRAPGFTPSDVDAALLEAVKAGTSIQY